MTKDYRLLTTKTPSDSFTKIGVINGDYIPIGFVYPIVPSYTDNSRIETSPQIVRDFYFAKLFNSQDWTLEFSNLKQTSIQFIDERSIDGYIKLWEENKDGYLFYLSGGFIGVCLNLPMFLLGLDSSYSKILSFYFSLCVKKSYAETIYNNILNRKPLHLKPEDLILWHATEEEIGSGISPNTNMYKAIISTIEKVTSMGIDSKIMTTEEFVKTIKSDYKEPKIKIQTSFLTIKERRTYYNNLVKELVKSEEDLVDLPF